MHYFHPVLLSVLDASYLPSCLLASKYVLLTLVKYRKGHRQSLIYIGLRAHLKLWWTSPGLLRIQIQGSNSCSSPIVRWSHFGCSAHLAYIYGHLLHLIAHDCDLQHLLLETHIYFQFLAKIVHCWAMDWLNGCGVHLMTMALTLQPPCLLYNLELNYSCMLYPHCIQTGHLVWNCNSCWFLSISHPPNL